MSDTMPALTWDREKDPWDLTRGLWKREVPRPVLDEERDPGDAERVLVKVHYAGFCGSDRSIWNRRAFGDMLQDSLAREGKTTRIVGHELLGEVLAMGSKAQATTHARVGDIVTTESHLVCGQCYQCQRREFHVCAAEKIIGITTDGCFAPYARLPARTLWPVELQKIRPEVAAIQEPFGNAVHCSQQVELRDKTLAIFGCGTIGLFLIAIAKALGAKRILGIEPTETHAAMARQLGVEEVIVPSSLGTGHAHDPAVLARILELTHGIGVDVAFEMAGAHSSVNNAIAAARRGGDVVLFGLKTGDATIEHFDRVIVKGLTLHGVIGRRIFETWEITKQLLEDPNTGVQAAVWNTILEQGQGTLVDFDSFDRGDFEAALRAHTKLVLKFSSSHT